MATEQVSPSGRTVSVAQDDGNFTLHYRNPDGSLGALIWHEWGQLGRTDTAVPAPLPDPTDPPAERPTIPGSAGGVRIHRLTDAPDGRILNVGQTYWPQAWIAPDRQTVFALVGHQDGYPRFFRVHRVSGRVVHMGPLLRYQGTGEGWYWTPDGRVVLCQGPALLRVQPLQLEAPVEILLDISQRFPGCDLWQAHSSQDGETHTATVRQVVSDGAYPKLGTIVIGPHGVRWIPVTRHPLDESAVDPSGRWVLIKEGAGPDNLVVDLLSGRSWWIADGDRAMGHSDLGSGFAVGEADKPDPGQCGRIDFAGQAYRGFFTTLNMGHISVKGATCLLSAADGISVVDLQTGGRTHLLDADPHDDTGLQAALDWTGRVAVYVTDTGGRLDAFLLDLGGG